MVKKYFYDTYGIQPSIINGDQMSLHRNERGSEDTPFKIRKSICKGKLHAFEKKSDLFNSAL